MTQKNHKFILDNGKLKKVPKTFKAKYSIKDPSEFFSPVTNLIPGLSSVSGARVLIGDKSSLQAMTLTNRQAPLVQAAPKDEKVNSFVKQFGKLTTVNASTSGTVTKIDEDKIVIKDASGKEHTHDKHSNYIIGRESFIHHDPTVKVGDKVKSGDLLAASNYSDKEGQLALGMNLKTAIMPFRSLNFEDALAISESAAQKLEGEQLIPVRMELGKGLSTDKDKYVSLFPNKFYNDQLSSIDSRGVVKKGTVLHHGDPVILAFQPKTLKSLDIQLGKLSSAIKNAFSDVSMIWEYEYPGEVADASFSGGLVAVTVKTKRPMSHGDKLNMPFGAKGVVHIVPDTQMPQGEDGKPVDVLLNTMSITSRVAPGLVNTMALGKVAEKTGKPVMSPGFTEKSSVQQAIDLLSSHGIKDTEKLYDPLSGKHIDVMTGPIYFNRLHHIAEDKVSTRSAATTYDINMQPSKAGSHEKAKRLGNLATTVALSNDAKAVLRDIATVRATKNDEFWTALKLGHNPPPPKVPFIFNKFISHLQGAGVNVQQDGSKFHILPQTDKDVVALSSGEIKEPLSYKLKKDALVAEDEGLFDPTLVGLRGDNYNHIALNHKIPNPMAEEHIRKLLNMTKVAYEEAIASGELEKKLKNIDLDKKLEELKSFISSKRKSGRDEAVKAYSFLTMLKQNDLKPEDMLLSKIPVIPAQYRPVMLQGDQVLTADINELYKDLMLVNNSYGEAKDLEYVDPEHLHTAKKHIYDGVKAIYGLGDPVKQKSVEKGYKGLLASALGLQGGSAKESMFQAKVVNKPIDLVGRAVLLPDSKLDMNQASIPQQIAWSIYAPFIIRRLVRQGIPATKAKEYLENKHPLALSALHEEMQDRPGIVTRDPQLSKYNFQGMYLKMNPDPKDFSLKLNPLVFKGYGGDSDGDQLNIQLPASDDAKEEVKEKLLPEKNLIYHRTFSPIYTPSNEAATGLFAASFEDKKNPPHKYASAQEVVRDFLAGKLDIGDRVDID
jgi:biotin carboxyl carrier protein